MTTELPIRQPTRLQNYDYSTPGAYFVTVFTLGRRKILSRVINGVVELTDYGQIVDETWRWLGAQYEYVELDEYVIMPDHFHGILILKPDDFPYDENAGGSRTAPTDFSTTDCRGRSGTARSPVKRKTLGHLIGAFKTVSTKNINERRNTPGVKLWQRFFYDHVIRDETDLALLRDYILNNPAELEPTGFTTVGERLRPDWKPHGRALPPRESTTNAGSMNGKAQGPSYSKS